MIQVIDWTTITNFVTEVFIKYGVPEADAAICADVLLESDRRGIESHGCNRFKPIYLDRIKSGVQKPVTNYEILKDSVSAATQRPTAMPTLSGDASAYTSVTTKSSASAIRTLQNKLVTLGWLDYSKISGKYDNATRQAVRDLQTYINEYYDPRPTLKVDGIAGPKTQQWLYQTGATRPTATPTPTATPKPKVTARPTENVIV